MSRSAPSVNANARANRTGLYLGFLQLVFTLGWTTYVIYLPKLAAQVGIVPSAVIFILMSAVSAALAIGETGAEGKMTGLLFSALALATFARMAAVAGGLQKLPDYAPLLHWAPVACWLVAGSGLLVITASRTRRHA